MKKRKMPVWKAVLISIIGVYIVLCIVASFAKSKAYGHDAYLTSEQLNQILDLDSFEEKNLQFEEYNGELTEGGLLR